MIRLGHRVSPADHRSDFSFSSSTSSTAFCAMEYERDDAARNRVMALLMQRDEMETEMEAIVSSLTVSRIRWMGNTLHRLVRSKVVS